MTEERRLKEAEDRARAEKERDQLRQKSTQILEREHVTVESLAANPSLSSITEGVAEAVRSVLREMREVEPEAAVGGQDVEEHLQLAKASTVAGEWLSAASHYDEYARTHPGNWEVHFLGAVAYANARRGHATDLSALRGFGDAIALIPDAESDNTRARLYTYRGAMLKRLGRLEEALSDLLLAEKYASEPYEIIDNQYNLACVYAMRREKDKMLKCLQQVALSPQYKHVIRHSRYFRNYREDKDLVEWLD